MPPVAASISTSIDSFCSVRSRAESRPLGVGGGRRVGLAGDPGEAEGGEVDDGPDPLLGELRGPERPFGAEVERGVGQEDGGAPGNSQRVEHEVAGPCLGVPSMPPPATRRRRSPRPRAALRASEGRPASQDGSGLDGLDSTAAGGRSPRADSAGGGRAAAVARARTALRASSRARSRAWLALPGDRAGSRRATAWAR